MKKQHLLQCAIESNRQCRSLAMSLIERHDRVAKSGTAVRQLKERAIAVIRPGRSGLSVIAICLIILLCSACRGSGETTSATPTPVRFNVLGTAANHSHSLLALSNGALVVATHFGIFRSADSGKSWSEVAGGSNQLMQDLMTFQMNVSSLNQQRLYALTFPAINPARGTLGLYTSADQGKNWKLTTTWAEVGQMYLEEPGNDTPDQVYLYLNKLGAHGLKVSMDAGQHFTETGTLPFGSIQGLLALPGAPGQLLAYGTDGMARSVDSGKSWQAVAGINGAIYEATTPGRNSPIYATGDAGIYASQDGGKSFTLVYSKSSYNGLAASVTEPQVLYGKLATGIFRSTDGGHSWDALPALKKSVQVMDVDPTNPARLYLATNYPAEVYRYDQSSAAWTALTPHQ